MSNTVGGMLTCCGAPAVIPGKVWMWVNEFYCYGKRIKQAEFGNPPVPVESSLKR